MKSLEHCLRIFKNLNLVKVSQEISINISVQLVFRELNPSHSKQLNTSSACFLKGNTAAG